MKKFIRETDQKFKQETNGGLFLEHLEGRTEARERRIGSSEASAAGPLLFVKRAEGGGGLHC